MLWQQVRCHFHRITDLFVDSLRESSSRTRVQCRAVLPRLRCAEVEWCARAACHRSLCAACTRPQRWGAPPCARPPSRNPIAPSAVGRPPRAHHSQPLTLLPYHCNYSINWKQVRSAHAPGWWSGWCCQDWNYVSVSVYHWLSLLIGRGCHKQYEYVTTQETLKTDKFNQAVSLIPKLLTPNINERFNVYL